MRHRLVDTHQTAGNAQPGVAQYSGTLLSSIENVVSQVTAQPIPQVECSACELELTDFTAFRCQRDQTIYCRECYMEHIGNYRDGLCYDCFEYESDGPA